MNKYTSLKYIPRNIKITVVSIMLSFFLVWTLQTVSAAYQKGAAVGRSFRVASVNVCLNAPNTVANKPNFTGCNSLV